MKYLNWEYLNLLGIKKLSFSFVSVETFTKLSAREVVVINLEKIYKAFGVFLSEFFRIHTVVFANMGKFR